MSSSDSDDGFYSNVAKNRELAREQCRMILLANSGLEDTKCSGENNTSDDSVVEITENTTSNTENVVKSTVNSSFTYSLEDNQILDEIIAKHSTPPKNQQTRSRINTETIIPPFSRAELVATNSRGRGRGKSRTSNNNVPGQTLDPLELLRGSGRRKRSSDSTSAIQDTRDVNRRGGGKKRSRMNSSPNSSIEEILPNLSPVDVDGIGSTRQRGRQRGVIQTGNTANCNPVRDVPLYPTYSVGNTDEYSDKSDEVPLFSKPATNTIDEVVDLDQTVTDEVDDNELLSVKVIWKSEELFKFTIRKYQKLTQIFEKFAKHENVRKDKLLFTYNNKILNCEDTPASIDYNIAKFIDGGVVSHNVQNIFNKAIKIKFQCQNIKKPLEIAVGNDNELSLAMRQCAEHLRVPLNKLKFEFDGDILADTNTPLELGLEDGDCIDVLMLS